MSFEVINLLGQTVIDKQIGRLPVGTHEIIWEGHDSFGQPVASGVYFYRLTTETGSASRKMVLVK